MYKGGYQIIDISGINFDLNKPEKVKGVYEKVSGTTKPIMISDFKVAGKHERAAFVQAVRNASSTDYNMLVNNATGNYLMTISKNDMFKIENA